MTTSQCLVMAQWHKAPIRVHVPGVGSLPSLVNGGLATEVLGCLLILVYTLVIIKQDDT